MDERQELINLIKKAGLPPADQAEWELLISSSPANYVGGLLRTFKEFPGEIGWFNSVYKRKKEAFSKMRNSKTKGEALFQKIVQEERDKLNRIVSKISN